MSDKQSTEPSDEQLSDGTGTGIVFMFGILLISLAVGTMANHPGWGWLILGTGFVVVSMLSYLSPRRTP